ncbi:MAG: CotH kinase family protein [Bacteroidia bacterium]
MLKLIYTPKNLITTVIFLVAYNHLLAQVNHYESVVLPGDDFKYLTPNAPVNSFWNTLLDDNENWETGPTGIGYGDNDDATVIDQTVSVFITRTFEIFDKTNITSLYLDIDYDDGFVAYINGKEIARSNVEGTPPDFDQVSTSWREAIMYNGAAPERYVIDPNILNKGQNKLAIQVHNHTATSSDLSIIPTLTLGIGNNKKQYRPVPSWFTFPDEKVVLSQSHLPIIVINTENNSEIPAEPKIAADMHIIYHPDSAINSVSLLEDTSALHYTGKIGIEVRGSSSMLIDKKQYALTTVNNSGDNRNVSLFGFPDENDWILNGLAYDSSLIRDFISYRLSERIGRYASRGTYCELILNGEYAGIYLFQEKLKVDDGRIDITKMMPYNIAGENLTGGYIVKADKIEGTDPFGWSMPNGIGWAANYVYEYPKPANIAQEQADYIQDYFWNLADNSQTPNIKSGYPSLIDIPSFVDFMILNELGSNGDAYQFSTFHHKDRNGKLKAGPIWDMNLTFGNDLFFWGYDRSLTDVWQFYDFENVGAAYWNELFNQPAFQCQLAKRWTHLSRPNGPLSAESIVQLIDSAASVFGDALNREEQTWQSATKFNEEVANMKTWAALRVDWLSKQLGIVTDCPQDKDFPLVISRIHYHPANVGNYLEDDLEYLELTNISDQDVDLTGLYFDGYDIVYQFPQNSSIKGNGKLYLANNTKIFSEFYDLEAFGQYHKNLSNSGYNLKLLDAFGNVIDEVPYRDENPWPSEADGVGYCLELRDVFSNNKLASNWRLASPMLEEPAPDQFNVALFPNPTKGLISLRSDRILNHISVHDLSGKQVLSFATLDNIIDLDLSILDSGIYSITLVSQTGQVQVRKISIISN